YNRISVYGDILSNLLLEADFKFPEESILCPVPLHWSRKYWRGFNQAEVLAEKISSEINLPVINLLKRIRPTGFQSHRNREERLLALNGAFKYILENHPPANIILIDDLATTGATLDECAKVLKKVGARRVEGWVIAHG
ncbi:MAG: ComF family protein, partial [Candidatus Peribacteraceae bacterium]|nr:ComF family protein [Candidatus Peribacteraceae bacterium]